MIQIVDEFFNSGLEQDAVLITASLNQRQTLKIIFDSPYEVSKLQNTSIENCLPQAMCKSSEVQEACQGDTLITGGVTYKISSIEPDGDGFTTLKLRLGS